MPFTLLLVLAAVLWAGCHNKPADRADETYRGSGNVTGVPSAGKQNNRNERSESRHDSPEPSAASAQDAEKLDPNNPSKDVASDEIDMDKSLDQPLLPGALSHSNSSAQPSDEVSNVPGAKGMIALTFDAGASAEPVADILKSLADTGSHATFFFTGKWVQKNGDTAKSILDAGHEAANHSWSHPDFTTLSDEDLIDQLGQTKQIFQTKLGTSGSPLFRPPFGARNRDVRRLVSSQGYRIIYWAVDCLDSVKKGITPEQIEARVLARAKQGDIVLMHCGSQATADALPTLIAALNKKGLKLVTVSELLKHE